MALIKTNYTNGKSPMPIPVAQEVMSAKVKLNLTAGQVANGNVLSLLKLPGDCVPVGYVLNAGDLDSGGSPTVRFDFGILNAAESAIATSLVADSTLAQAGGILLHTASKTAYDALGAVTVDDEDRSVGIIFDAAAATAQAGFIELELFYKSV